MRVSKKQSFSPGNLIQAKAKVNGVRSVFIILKARQSLNFGLVPEEEFYVHGTNYLGEETTMWMWASIAQRHFEVIS